MGLTIFLFLASLLFSTSHAKFEEFNPIQLLRPRSGAGGHRLDGLDCLSWRLAVETNNRRDWKAVPQPCAEYVGKYMIGDQYGSDCEAVADAAIEYAESLEVAADGKDVWVFDIDETTLSNLPYYSQPDIQFGALPFNSTKFHEWVAKGEAEAVPAILRLYKTVLRRGFKTIILTGSRERVREARIANLNKVGYKDWEMLILKGESEHNTSVVYKSTKRTELVEKGYRIVGNVGDQWSDLIGANPGNRTFKVPNPMYYSG